MTIVVNLLRHGADMRRERVGEAILSSAVHMESLSTPYPTGVPSQYPGIQPEEFSIEWADPKHGFVQATTANRLNICKVDIDSGKRELWQTITPKDATGLRPMVIPTAVTRDGRWMAFGCRTQLGPLYRSDTLKQQLAKFLASLLEIPCRSDLRLHSVRICFVCASCRSS
jgi:hypothetical protein